MVRIPFFDDVTLTFTVGDEPLRVTPNDSWAPLVRWAYDRSAREWVVFFFDDLRAHLTDDRVAERWARVFLDELTARGVDPVVGELERRAEGRVERSRAVLAVLDHHLAKPLGQAFGFRHLVVSAGKHSPPDLVQLPAAHAVPRDAGLPMETADGSRWRVIALNVDDVFAGLIEGGPRGVEVAARVRGEARMLFGGPVVLRGPGDDVVALDRRQVVQRLPRVCCCARVVVDHDARSGGALPTPLSVVWLTDAVGNCSVEELLRAGLSDVVIGETNAPVGTLGALDARTPPPFAGERFTSLDGFIVRAESLWFLPGPTPSAALTWTQAEWVPGHDAFVHHAHPSPGSPDDVALHADEASLLVALVAAPFPTAAGDVGATVDDGTWTSSRATVLAVIKRDGAPLRDAIAGVVGRLRWADVAKNVDDTP
jgi:hypothetical protein